MEGLESAWSLTFRAASWLGVRVFARFRLSVAPMNLRIAIAAAVLTIPATRVVHGAAQLVTLSPGGGVLTVPGGPSIPMTAIGSGVRTKTILFVTVRVYTARLLVSGDAAAFERTPARELASLDAMPAVAMHLVFERSVSPGQLGDSLDAAMRANGYDVTHDTDLQALSKAIRSSDAIPSGSTAILAAIRVDPQVDLVVYQSPSGAIASVSGRSGLKRALMSAWFGTPADGGLRGLRDEILGTRPGR
jgi:hypothetical protein